MSVRLQATLFDPANELRHFAEARDGAGALASFVGYVRGEPGLETLELEHYPGLTDREIARIESEALARFLIMDTLIIHRFGVMRAAEPIVLVAALGRHRKDAFVAVDFLMDHLKSDAPFWKREVRSNGARWIEPTAQDHAALANWKKT